MIFLHWQIQFRPLWAFKVDIIFQSLAIEQFIVSHFYTNKETPKPVWSGLFELIIKGVMLHILMHSRVKHPHHHKQKITIYLNIFLDPQPDIWPCNEIQD